MKLDFEARIDLYDTSGLNKKGKCVSDIKIMDLICCIKNQNILQSKNDELGKYQATSILSSLSFRRSTMKFLLEEYK